MSQESNLKIADRVAVYSSGGRDTGMVVFIQPDGFLQIKYDSGQLIYPLHPKQCRKLKPKKRRSVWVVFDEIGVCREFSSMHPSKLLINQDLDWVECREVKK